MHHRPVGRALCLFVLFLAGCGEDDAATYVGAEPTTTTPSPDTTTDTAGAVTTITVDVTGGQVSGGERREVVTLDETVRLEITGDAADEVHVHTYDLHADVGPGSPAVIEFTADIPGVHEVELSGGPGGRVSRRPRPRPWLAARRRRPAGAPARRRRSVRGRGLRRPARPRAAPPRHAPAPRR